MRNDQAPFTDAAGPAGRGADARPPGMVSRAAGGDGQLGNDSPFGPRYPSTDTSVPQRTQDIAKAKQLLAAAGHPAGSASTLTTEQYQEIPELAQVIQADAAKAGINIKLTIETQTAYYGKATYGNSDWLDGTMSLVDYGDRGVPNVYLEAPLTSKRPVERRALQEQRRTTRWSSSTSPRSTCRRRSRSPARSRRLLLEETPIVIPYFIDGLTATNDEGRTASTRRRSAQIYLNKAYIS